MSWVLAASFAWSGLLVVSGAWGWASGIYRVPRRSLVRAITGRRGGRLLALGLVYLIASTLLIHRQPTGVLWFVVGGGPAIIAILYRFMVVI